MELDTFTSTIDSGTVERIENERQSRFTHILVLREVTAPARFTTDGETVNMTRVRMGTPGEETVEIRAVDLFYRKQPGAERRIAKSLQRDVLGDVSEDCAEDSMHPNEMQQNSPESVLLGSAAASEGVSQRSRVYYNSAYSLRDAPKVTRQNIQNAPGDDQRNVSAEGQGTWTPDFVLPGALFPSVITLDSAIAEEVLFMLGVISRTTRYGAGETRGGNVRNHILGVRAGRHDAPSNLEVAREVVGSLAATSAFDSVDEVVNATTLDTEQVAEMTVSAFDALSASHGIEFTKVGREDTQSVVNALREQAVLEDVMTDQLEAVNDYVSRAPSSD